MSDSTTDDAIREGDEVRFARCPDSWLREGWEEDWRDEVLEVNRIGRVPEMRDSDGVLRLRGGVVLELLHPRGGGRTIDVRAEYVEKVDE